MELARARGAGAAGLPEELEVSSFFSSSSLSLLSPPVSVPASLSLSVSLDSSTLMVGVLGLLLLGSLPRLRPPGRLGGVLIRSAVRAAANSLAPSYEGKQGDVKVKFYSSFCWRRKGCISEGVRKFNTIFICISKHTFSAGFRTWALHIARVVRNQARQFCICEIH